jgi:adenosylcobinamide-phosphate synthase
MGVCPTCSCGPVGAFASAADLVAVLVAVGLDLATGDPPNRVHPVAWLGRLVAAGRRRFGAGSPSRLLAHGAALTIGVASIAALAGWGVTRIAARTGAAEPFLVGAALSLLLSLRGLFAAALEVARHLAAQDLPAARQALAWHLVSRPTGDLPPGLVASGAVESVAENLTDAYVAPLVFFLVFGLPGAAFYRAVNTADAMIGYRDGALEYFGKTAARLDDVLNIVPARLAALAIVGAAALTGGDTRLAWRTLLRDRVATASPNAGWTMAATAGALGVTLEKPGAYRLGAGDPPSVEGIRRSIVLAGTAAALLTAILLALAAVVPTAVARP